jgi:hypothetical protein
MSNTPIDQPVRFGVVDRNLVSNLTQTGNSTNTKKTSLDGFHLSIDVLKNIFQANGTMNIILNGHVFTQPAIVLNICAFLIGLIARKQA